MISGGDELGRTQGGNNNAYCQDNATSWFNWGAADKDLLAFTREVIAIRRRHPVLRRRRYATGALAGDIAWYAPAGSSMTDSDWNAGRTLCVIAYFNGTCDTDRDDHGRPILDDDLLIALNGWWESTTFTIPDVGRPRVWVRELDTLTGQAGSTTSATAATETLATGAQIVVGPRSLVLLRSVR
jgi:glycogen operon protein